MTWWFGQPPTLIAHDPLGVLADRRVTDVSLADDPLEALHQRAADYAPGDTDLAWTRATIWRALCASAFDSIDRSARSAVVTGAPGGIRGGRSPVASGAGVRPGRRPATPGVR